jgi:hypothetical protein
VDIPWKPPSNVDATPAYNPWWGPMDMEEDAIY